MAQHELEVNFPLSDALLCDVIEKEIIQTYVDAHQVTYSGEISDSNEIL